MDPSPIRILLVEDNYGDARLIREMLQEGPAGRFDFFYADRLSVAFKYLLPGSVDVALVDLSLPDSQGLDTYRQMRLQAPNLPVIVMSGLNDENVALEAMQKGAQDYLVKGQVDGRQLERAIRYAIERAKILEELHHSQHSLRTTKDQLEETLRNLYEELETAKKVQESFLPGNLASLPGVRTATQFLPCQYIGGDLYDAVQLDEYRLAFLVFDVTGHGVTSALISAMAKISFRRHITATASPRTIIREVNLELMKFLPEDRFISAFLGILDTRARTFTFVRASHPPALLVHPAGGTVDLLECKGFLIGLFPEKEYEECSVPVTSGDKIIMYTDGLIEIFNAKNELFGKTRLLEVMRETARLPVAETVARVIAETKAFSTPATPMDDITILGIQIL
jgi:serine phosphatase RsbU (regulator of sigma subunit)